MVQPGSVHGKLYSSLCVSIWTLRVPIWPKLLPIQRKFFHILMPFLIWVFKLVDLKKNPTTNYALVRSLIQMWSGNSKNSIKIEFHWFFLFLPHMSPKCSRMAEFFPAHFTRIRLVVCMNSNMRAIRLHIEECFVTLVVRFVNEFAFVWSFSSVHFSNVRFVFLELCERSVALLAFKRTMTKVDSANEVN